jgi:hypothetical protein
VTYLRMPGGLREKRDGQAMMTRLQDSGDVRAIIYCHGEERRTLSHRSRLRILKPSIRPAFRNPDLSSLYDIFNDLTS